MLAAQNKIKTKQPKPSHIGYRAFERFKCIKIATIRKWNLRIWLYWNHETYNKRHKLLCFSSFGIFTTRTDSYWLEFTVLPYEAQRTLTFSRHQEFKSSNYLSRRNLQTDLEFSDSWSQYVQTVFMVFRNWMLPHQCYRPKWVSWTLVCNKIGFVHVYGIKETFMLKTRNLIAKEEP